MSYTKNLLLLIASNKILEISRYHEIGWFENSSKSGGDLEAIEDDMQELFYHTFRRCPIIESDPQIFQENKG